MIEDIFKQYTPCFVKLRDYGFVQGRVFDIANKEEYSPLHIENWQGTFVNEVRSAYKDILLDIRDICFVRLNRVLV